jgi:2-iminobutanoate/2-iminopropanoate deaminase
MHTQVTTAKAPSAIGPYSQAICTGNRLYISGQLGVDASTGTLPETFEEQAGNVMKNIKFLLVEAGFDFTNIVKTTIFLADLENFGVVNEIYGAYFPDYKPARSCFEVSRLPKNAQIEIEVIAER